MDLLQRYSAADQDGGSGWREVLDPESGHNYYTNDLTGESSWEAPAEYAPPADEHTPTRMRGLSVAEKRQMSVSGGQLGLGDHGWQAGTCGGWREALDPESGHTYFYNDITEESAWEAPAGYAPPADEAPVRMRGLSVVEKKQLSAHSPRALRGKREANADSGFEGGIELGEVGGRQALHAEGETKSE